MVKFVTRDLLGMTFHKRTSRSTHRNKLAYHIIRNSASDIADAIINAIYFAAVFIRLLSSDHSGQPQSSIRSFKHH